jgi:hypothetical protein
MKAFRIYLVIVIASLGTYTMIVGLHHGWHLLPIFFTDLAAMTWPGQFNFDFSTFLLLSGFWLAWRNQFSVGGLALGILGVFGGMMVLAPYLLYAGYQAHGDVRVLLLGKARAGG